ncbi:MAG: sigma-70 family RNA polymerase sigma factor [Bacteroidales bacterium]|nr:sigma-70 family RNA polymerase sigma factor [Bacteroidales bacterium]
MPPLQQCNTKFADLVMRHRDLIWHICSDYSLSAAWETEDAFQEVLCALWRDMNQFEGRSSERTWIYRVASNTMLMLKRRQSNRPAPNGTALPQTAETNDNYNLLLQLIDQLPDADCRIVRAHLDGFSNAEIATICGSTTAAIAMKLSRIKKKLKHKYEAER